MSEIVFLDAIGRTADILAAIETSIIDEDRAMIETLTFDLHAVLSGINGCTPNSEEERARAEKIFETTLRLEKVLADRMASNDSVGVRRKPKHKPGRVSYTQ
jgi:hypothetical protein